MLYGEDVAASRLEHEFATEARGLARCRGHPPKPWKHSTRVGMFCMAMLTARIRLYAATPKEHASPDRVEFACVTI